MLLNEQLLNWTEQLNKFVVKIPISLILDMIAAFPAHSDAAPLCLVNV